MKQLNQFITEYIIKKKLDKPIDSEDHCEYFPDTKEELIENIKECFNDKRYNLNCIDTSKITDMSYVFKLITEAHNVNFDISDWDVSNVEYMQHMFFECTNFDCDLSNWNISKVENISHMFYDCIKFDCDLSNWDVNNVTNMRWMFYNCNSFKNIPSWYQK